MVLRCTEIPISQVPTWAPPTWAPPTWPPPSTEVPTTIAPTPASPTTEPATSPVPQLPTQPPVLFFRGKLIQGEKTQQKAAPQTNQWGLQGAPGWGHGGGYQQWAPQAYAQGYRYQQWAPRAYAQDNQRWGPWQYGPYRAYSQSYPMWNPYIQWRDYARQNERARIQNMYGFNKK